MPPRLLRVVWNGWRLRATALAVAASLAAALVALVLAGSDGAPHADHLGVVEPGASVDLHLQVFDTDGRLLYSTKKADNERIALVADGWPGRFHFPPLDADKPARHVFANDTDTVPLQPNATFPLRSQDFVGKPIGHSVRIPVSGHLDYHDVVSFSRVRGPFNHTIPVKESLLTKLQPEGGGDRFVLDDLFAVDVVERNGDDLVVRIDVEDGDVLPIHKPGWEAEVLFPEGASQFHLRVDTEVGHSFSLSERCVFGQYVLPIGSYRVVDVTNDTIVMAYANTPWVQLLGRDLVVNVEVAGIRGEDTAPERVGQDSRTR